MTDFPVMVEQTIQINLDIPQDAAKGLLCTGFESGVAYWCCIEKYLPCGIDDECGGWAPAEVPFIGGTVVLSITDAGPGEENLLHLDLDAIQRGLKLMAANHPKHFADFMVENYDAITGDVFIQLCVFGEIIYG